MSFLSGISDIVSTLVSAVVTAYTGNPMLGQLAGNLVNSALSDSGSSGNSGFDDVLNGALSKGFLQAVGG